MDKVRFDGMDSYDKWGYYLAHKVIGDAEPKYNLVQVPGGVGYIDLTGALGVIGYNERELELTMKDIADHNEFIRHYSAMQADIHGKRCKITLSDDPGYYWDGRCSVGAMEQDGTACYVPVVVICQPYKLKQSKTVVQYNSLTNKYKQIMLSNDTMPTIPTITVQQDTTIEYNGATYSINTGTHRILGIVLGAGGGKIKAKAPGGSGSIKIEYQEGGALMYRITYGQYILYDPRGANEIDNLVVLDPVIPLTVTGSGVAEFTLLPTHPHLANIRKLRGIVEVLENDDVIYRGRVVGNTKNFDLSRRISVEGITSCLNDSIIEPYNFPGDFIDDPEYQAAAESGNVVDYYFRWLLGQHNNQVSDEQKILPGNVTVTDPNNYITRSKENPEVVSNLVKALPESSLGGYLMVRYEADGTYLDYVADLPLTNAQPVEFGQNLLDLIAEYDATETCTAVRPVGKDGLDISLEQDGDVDDDIVKAGNIVYSKSGRQTYGKITKLVQFSETTVAKNLVSSAAKWLRSNGLGENESITCTAVDLHLVDSDVASLRVGRHTLVSSLPHGFENQFPLLEMSLDIINPQNTSITMGRTRRTFTGEQIGADANINIKLDEVKNNVSGQIGSVTTEIERITEAQHNSEQIILSALEKKVETSDFETYQQEQKSELEILSNQINITVTETEQKIKDAVDGIDSVTTSTGYTFGADGLRIAKQGEQMENKLDNTGMYVTRDNVPILTANNQGVTALNMTAHQYLIVGQNSRFEDYTGDGGEARTGCFWIGGV